MYERQTVLAAYLFVTDVFSRNFSDTPKELRSLNKFLAVCFAEIESWVFDLADSDFIEKHPYFHRDQLILLHNVVKLLDNIHTLQNEELVLGDPFQEYAFLFLKSCGGFHRV